MARFSYRFDGSFSYTPTLGFTGTDAFTYSGVYRPRFLGHRIKPYAAFAVG